MKPIVNIIIGMVLGIILILLIGVAQEETYQKHRNQQGK